MKRFNTVINEKYEENPYKRTYINQINKIGFDCEDGEDNNIHNNNLKNNNIVSLDENKLKILNKNFLNLNKNLIPNKNDYKSNNNNIHQNNYFIYNNFIDNNNKLNNNFHSPLPINLSDLTTKEINTGHADLIPESICDKLYNSITKISLKSGTATATGFFMKIKLNNKIKKCLFTCFHVISDQDIQNQIIIDIYFGKKVEESHRKIKLDKNKRFIKAYKEEEDVTLIEIIDDDNISDGKYLNPDLNYERGYNRYLDKNFYLAGYPKNYDERCISTGKIIQTGIEKENYKFYHELDTRSGSSGSPITNDKGDVIGIHTDGIASLNKNIGTFIGKILDNLKAENNFKNNGNNKFLRISTYNFYYDGNNKDIHYSNINNFIQGEIYIKEEQINKKIRIINSYDNYKREKNENCDSKQGNEREIMENCVIKINDKEIPFSYYYTFPYSGKFKIEYFFKNYLINTSYIFYNCNSLTNLNLSNFNATNVIDMSSMFNFCKSLTNLDLSNFNTTTNVTHMSFMFSNCESLTNLDLSNFNTTNVIDMSYMFSGCESLTNLDLSYFNTTNVTDMSNMFSYCNSLTNLNLSKFNTTNVIDMSHMFICCISLTNLNLSNFNATTNVTHMSFMFSNCNSLTNLDLSNFNTTNVTDMSYMFCNCNSLTNLNLSNFNTTNVTNMSYMFGFCKTLTNLNLSKFNTTNVINMSFMFGFCNSLTNLDLSNFITTNVTDMSSMFSNCNSLTNLNLSNFNTTNVNDMSFMFGFCNSLTNLNLPKNDKKTCEKIIYQMNIK